MTHSDFSIQKFWQIVNERLTEKYEKPVTDWNVTEIKCFLDDFKRTLIDEKGKKPKLFDNDRSNIPTSIHYDTFVDIFKKQISNGKEGTQNAFAIYIGYDNVYHCLTRRKFHADDEFRFQKIDIKYDLVFNRTKLQIDSIKRVNVLVESLTDELNFVTHRVFNKISSFNNHLQYDVHFISGKMIDLNITHTFEQKIGASILQVNFQKPLKKGEVIAYELIIKTNNTNLLTWEDFYAFNNRVDVNGEKLFGARYGLQLHLLKNSKQINLQILFPENYPIHQPRFVIFRKGDVIEYININQDNFRQSKIDNRISLELNIQNAFIMLPHTIFWNPPSIDELLKSNYINEEEAKRIYERTDSFVHLALESE